MSAYLDMGHVATICTLALGPIHVRGLLKSTFKNYRHINEKAIGLNFVIFFSKTQITTNNLQQETICF